jgi:hypothetical protein
VRIKEERTKPPKRGVLPGFSGLAQNTGSADRMRVEVKPYLGRDIEGSMER